ncbi:hypothetical protein H8356DRAFT_1378901 [Neocallimastix lanati (nom. inval.)]|nr:hypothetical protein H8356DRAFT_1378901 [Neocallimastix sp. JGI-2020a]
MNRNNYSSFIKCEDNRCVLNENGDIKLCIDGHCGRFVGDPCTIGDECAKGYCDEECIFPKQPERETNTKHNLEFFGILGFLIIIVFIVFFSNTKYYKQFTDCYNRNEHTSMRFVPNNIDNPDDFDIKSYVNIKSNKCYCENES